MESRFIIFVVFAILAQSELRILPSNSSGRQAQLIADYSALEALHTAGISGYSKAFGVIFTDIKKYLDEFHVNDKNETGHGDNNQSTIDIGQSEVFAGFIVALDTSLDAVLIDDPEAFTAITTIRPTTYSLVEALVAGIYSAIELARETNVSAALVEIEVIEETAATGCVTLQAVIFDAVRNGRITSAKTETTIQSTQDKVSSVLVTAIRSVFGGIKTLLAAISSGTKAARRAAVSAIRTSQNEVSSLLETELEIKFAFFKSRLIADSLFQAIIFADSSAIPNSRETRVSEYVNTVDETLLLTDPPTFNVTNLQINETTTQIAIWGDCGIAVVELPKRWGKDAAFQGGKEVVSCRSHSLDERLFHCSGVTEVRRARWHPGSTKDCHLLVLTSENTFHLYECELNGPQSLVKTWSVGPGSGSPSKIPTPASLGEAAVDFDFVTPTLKPDIDIKEIEIDEINWNDIEWSILVLKGNGDICTVQGNILNPKSEKSLVTGPLSIYPRADDNYGVDSCSIMCLQTTPPLVVIATSNGKVYHSILLREDFEDDEKKTWSQYGSTFSLHTPEDALFVFECVEMELGLCIREDDKKYSCPVHLHVDRGNSSRYFCSHNAGIHIVNLPMVSQLEEYIQRKDEDADVFLPNLSNQSSSQYLVCTRTKSTQDPAPILGFGLLQDPCVLIALLHTGIAISLSVVDLHYLVKIQLLEPIMSPSKKMAKEPFDVLIKNLLKHDISQPILKLGPNVESSPQEVLELLLRATHVFRNEHFARQDKVQSEIAKRTRTLRALKIHQLKELESLAETRKELQEAAEHLAERYEDIKDKQEEFVRRTKEVLRLIKQREPSMSAIEKEEANELKKMENKRKELSQQLEKLKNKAKYQSEQLTNWDRNEAKKDVVISKSQEDTIKANLTQMSEEIGDLVSTLKSLEEDVSS